MSRSRTRRTRTSDRLALLRSNAGEIATAAALLTGWLLITAGIATIAHPRIVWLISLGLLLVSLAGWNTLGQSAWFGLYTLMKD